MSYLKYPRLLAHLTLVAVVLLPLIAAGTWIFFDQFAPYYGFDLQPLGATTRGIGLLLYLTIALIHAYGLLGVRQTFLEAATGRALSKKSVLGFRRFAWVSLTLVLLKELRHTGTVVILSASNPDTPGSLSFQFGSPQISALFTALLLVFVAYVFTEGKRAREENDSFF